MIDGATGVQRSGQDTQSGEGKSSGTIMMTESSFFVASDNHSVIVSCKTSSCVACNAISAYPWRWSIPIVSCTFLSLAGLLAAVNIEFTFILQWDSPIATL
jgi:hypothetical protein